MNIIKWLYLNRGETHSLIVRSALYAEVEPDIAFFSIRIEHLDQSVNLKPVARDDQAGGNFECGQVG